MTEQQAIPWYQSTGIRQGLLAVLPGLIALLKLYHIDRKLHIDFSAVDIEGLADLAITIAAFGTGAWILIHRVLRGKDPKDPAPPIQTPAAVSSAITAIKRVTREVGK